MTGITDFHTHAFPDELAATAIPFLEKEGNVKAFLDGTVNDLLRSMDRAEIDRSVICSIATRPKQFRSILEWSKSIRSDRIVPLPSVHPGAVDLSDQVRIIREEGFSGIKMHPYYQDFFIDADRLSILYESLIEYNLFVVMHTGFDIAFPRMDLCTPERVVRVLDRFAGLQLITTHLGAWDDWEQARRMLIGRPVYMEISYALDFLDPALAREMIVHHPADYILFGSDSPWSDQKKTLELLSNLELESGLMRKITSVNADALLKGRG